MRMILCVVRMKLQFYGTEGNAYEFSAEVEVTQAPLKSNVIVVGIWSGPCKKRVNL
jgi:hypothetical protein